MIFKAPSNLNHSMVCSGLDLGLERLGWRCSVGCVGINPGPPPRSQRCPIAGHGCLCRREPASDPADILMRASSPCPLPSAAFRREYCEIVLQRPPCHAGYRKSCRVKYPAPFLPAGPTGRIVSTAREQYLSFHPRNIYYMIRFRCLFGEEGKSEGEIDLSFLRRRGMFHPIMD